MSGERVAMVNLPSGLRVPRLRGYLPESCPKREEHAPDPADLDLDTGESPTMVQAKHETCGLWVMWVPYPGEHWSAATPAEAREEGLVDA